MKSKYLACVEKTVNEFWIKNNRPPGVRDIQIACGINSTSHVMTLLRALPSIEVVDGHAIPKWVKDAIEKAIPVC